MPLLSKNTLNVRIINLVYILFQLDNTQGVITFDSISIKHTITHSTLSSLKPEYIMLTEFSAKMSDNSF